MRPEVASPLSALSHYTMRLRTLLADPDVTELCIQRPGEVYLESPRGWCRLDAPWVTLAWCQQFARLLATDTAQRVNEHSPLLSATLPSGERVQVVLPPATTKGQVVISLRRPSSEAWSLAELARRDFFGRAVREQRTDTHQLAELSSAYEAGDWLRFLQQAVRSRLNLLVAGSTGSGKTTLTKALIAEIPTDERLISIEDAAELDLRTHSNSVRLFYSKDDQGSASVTPKQLLEACLRLRPDRIMLAELRGEEAYYFLRNVSSGHPGSITSIHAGNISLAFGQLALLVKESVAGRDLPLADISRLLHEVLDVVVHCERAGGHRYVTAVYWRAADGRRSVIDPMGLKRQD